MSYTCTIGHRLVLPARPRQVRDEGDDHQAPPRAPLGCRRGGAAEQGDGRPDDAHDSIHESLYSNHVSFIRRAIRKVGFGQKISPKLEELQRFSSIQAARTATSLPATRRAPHRRRRRWARERCGAGRCSGAQQTKAGSKATGGVIPFSSHSMHLVPDACTPIPHFALSHSFLSRVL